MINILVVFLLGQWSYGGEVPHSFFSMGSHCVGYKAHKRLLLLASVEVKGKSCDILVQVIPEVGDTSHIEVSFPLGTLRSGEEKRDQDVTKLLSNGENLEFRFQSETLSNQEWKRRINLGSFQVGGKLKLKDGDQPVDAQIQLLKSESGPELDGVIKTSFSALHIPPPQLGFGLFASVSDELELHFHFLANRSLGADALLEN